MRPFLETSLPKNNGSQKTVIRRSFSLFVANITDLCQPLSFHPRVQVALTANILVKKLIENIAIFYENKPSS